MISKQTIELILEIFAGISLPIKAPDFKINCVRFPKALRELEQALIEIQAKEEEDKRIINIL